MAFALLLFLAMGFGFLFSFDDHPLYLVITLVFLGAVLGGALFTVAIIALAHRSVGGRLIPAETDPADVRAARRALRTGQLSDRFQVDRITRVLASHALRHEVRPWMSALMGTFFGGFNLFNAWAQYVSHDGWHWIAVLCLALGVFMLVVMAVLVPWEARSMRRTRAFAEAYDARRRKRPPEWSERP